MPIENARRSSPEAPRGEKLSPRLLVAELFEFFGHGELETVVPEVGVKADGEVDEDGDDEADAVEKVEEHLHDGQPACASMFQMQLP